MERLKQQFEEEKKKHDEMMRNAKRK